MQLTQQIRIFPTNEQKELLWKLSEKNRLIYNFALRERKEAFEKGVKGINYRKQQNDLPTIKEKYSEYKWVYSRVLQHTLRNLDTDYKSFFGLWKKGNKDAKPPKFKGEKYFTTMTHNQRGFKNGKGFITLSHNRSSDVELKFVIPEKFIFEKIYQISIYQKDNEFFLSITYEEPEKEYHDNGIYQAFDMGVTKHTGVNSRGKFVEFINQRPDKFWQKKIEKIQSRKDHCKGNSKKYDMLNKNLNRMKRKSSNQLKDFQHKLSRKIVDNTKANTIIVGKLEIKKLSQKNKYAKCLHRSLQNTGNISRLVRFLTYKSNLIGKRVIEINERGTTRTCCVCGKEHIMPLHKRIMSCDCGNRIDRDKNSAVNIMVRFLSQNALWTSYQEFLGNMRQTGLPFLVMCSHEAPSERVV